MVHQSTRRFAPPVRRLCVGRYFTSGTLHLTLRCQRKGATIDLGKNLQHHSNPVPSNSKNPAGAILAGSAFAVGWIVTTFKHGVTTEAFLRVLERKESDEMNFPGHFEPHLQAYDGFISKVGVCYECCICKEGNRTRWKHKKDTPRHLCKFHFPFWFGGCVQRLMCQTAALFFAESV